MDFCKKILTFASLVSISTYLTVILGTRFMIMRDFGQYDKFLEYDCKFQNYGHHLDEISSYCRKNGGEIKCRMEDEYVIEKLNSQQEFHPNDFGSLCCHGISCGFNKRKTVCDWEWKQETGDELKFCNDYLIYSENVKYYNAKFPENVPTEWETVANFILKNDDMDLGFELKHYINHDLLTEKEKQETIEWFYTRDLYAKKRIVKYSKLRDEIVRKSTSTLADVYTKRRIINFLKEMSKSQ